MDRISIVIPCYNEEEVIELFYNEITKVFSQVNAEYELIFVDDGSSDKTMEKVKQLPPENVKYISFSRNFGKEAAILAGLKKSKGDYVATIDADLQDPPEMVAQMYDILKSQDYDCVSVRRSTREGEPKIRSFFARHFYSVMNKLIDGKIQVVEGERDFRLMKRSMADAVISMPEADRFSKGIFCYVGFKTKWLEYKNVERAAGKTKWSFFGLLKYALSGIVAFSTKVLLFPVVASFLSILASLACFIALTVCPCGTVLIIAIMLLLFGIMFGFLGILGLYIAKMFKEIKKRPTYFIREEK